MNRLLSLILFISISFLGSAQLTGIFGEVIADHDTTGIEGLEGWKTYHVYAELNHPSDEISALYGDDNAPWIISAEGGFFQADLGDDFGWSINTGIISFVPDVAFDSWLTLNAANSSEVNGLTNTIGLNESTLDSFNNGGDFNVSTQIGASIFTLAGDPMGQAGDDFRVLIAQLTAQEPPSGLFNLQVFAQGMQNNSFGYVGVPIEYAEADGIAGCTYAAGSNFLPEATVDDGSCEFQGCMNPSALNYDGNATEEDGSCLFLGCMDPFGLDYDDQANVPGMCLYSSVCASDFDNDGTVDVNDLLLFFETYGYSCGD